MNPDPVHHLTVEFADFWERDHDVTIPMPPRTRPLDNEWIERLIGRVDAAARKAVIERVEEMWDEEVSAEERDRLLTHMFGAEDRITGWMRIGYRRALRRYRGLDSFELCDMFDRVSKEVNRLLEDQLTEGDHVRISLNLQSQEITLKRLD